MPVISTMSLMDIDLAFGKTGLRAGLPEGFRYRVLEARTATPLPDWHATLERALELPHQQRLRLRRELREIFPQPLDRCLAHAPG